MSEEQDDEALDSEESDQDDSDAPEAAPAIDPGKARVQQYLKDLQAAQSQASQNSMGVGLARAGATMANALSGSQRQVDSAPFDQLDKSAQAPVQSFMAKQKTASDALNIENQSADAQASEDARNPNSQKSIIARSLFKKNYPEAAAALTPEQFNKMTAADVTNQLKDQEVTAKIGATKEDHAQRLADREQTIRDKADAKTSADQDKSLTQMRKDMQNYRGNTAVQQAAVKIQNADTALAIVKGKDPNTLSVQDLRLLSDEMAKIATGGVPGEHGTEALMPNTLRSKLAEMQSFLMNKPTDAQAGEYIRHNMEYLEEMKKVAQGTLNKYRINIAKGWKHRVRQEDYNDAMNDYPELSEGGGTPAGAAVGGHDLHASVQAEMQRRQAAKAKSSVASMVPNLSQGGGANAQGVPASLQPNQPEGFAYGGMVGGLPSSNFAASQMSRSPHPPHLNLHSPRGYCGGGEVHNYQSGGQVPGVPNVPRESPVNDTVQANLTPKEIVLPLHVTQAKDPALAAYLYMKRLHGKVQ